MTATLRLGEAQPMRHRARLAEAQDASRVRALRHLCRTGGGADRQDALAYHILIEDPSGGLAGCLRLRVYKESAALADSEAARSYDLSPLLTLPGPAVEVGRLCLHPDAPQAEVLRVAWGAIDDLCRRARAQALLSLCPFEGTDPAPHAQAFALLRADHVAPPEWLPASRAPGAVPLASLGRRPDRVAALRALPPFLRNLLGMGGWVADHAVPDPDAGALDLLAVLDLSRVPRARASALRAVPRLG